MLLIMPSGGTLSQPCCSASVQQCELRVQPIWAACAASGAAWFTWTHEPALRIELLICSAPYVLSSMRRLPATVRRFIKVSRLDMYQLPYTVLNFACCGSVPSDSSCCPSRVGGGLSQGSVRERHIFWVSKALIPVTSVIWILQLEHSTHCHYTNCHCKRIFALP
jgi:hypothetical protein